MRARGPVLALDLGATQIRAAAVREDGSIEARMARPTPVAEGPEAILAACVEALRASRAQLRAADPAAERALIGISLSSPGPIDPWRGVVVQPPNLGPEFMDVPIAERVERELRLPAYLDRDTQIAALGEGVFGAARDTDNYLYVTVSSGVGGAIVTEGRLLMGPDGTAGELGHFPVDFHGPRCGCGGIGHLEAFASGVNLAKAARRAIDAGRGGPLVEFARARGIEDIDARHLAEAEDAGIEAAHEIMEEARRAFAAACVGWVDYFDPDLIVVGGSIAQGQGDRLLGPARETVAREAFKVPRRRVRIVPAALGDDVSLVGGLVLVHERSGDAQWRAGRPDLGQAPAANAATAPERTAAQATPVGSGAPQNTR